MPLPTGVLQLPSSTDKATAVAIIIPQLLPMR